MEQLKEQIEQLTKDIQDLEECINNFELDPYDYEDSYCEMQNEQGMVEIGYLTFEPAEIVRELDPTAYRCGLIDYVDSIDVSDSPDYQDLEEELEDLQSELEDLEEQLAELEDEE